MKNQNHFSVTSLKHTANILRFSLKKMHEIIHIWGLNAWFWEPPFIGEKHTVEGRWPWQLFCFVSMSTHSTSEPDTWTFEKNCCTDCPKETNSQVCRSFLEMPLQNRTPCLCRLKQKWDECVQIYGSKHVGIAAYLGHPANVSKAITVCTCCATELPVEWWKRSNKMFNSVNVGRVDAMLKPWRSFWATSPPNHGFNWTWELEVVGTKVQFQMRWDQWDRS